MKRLPPQNRIRATVTPRLVFLFLVALVIPPLSAAPSISSVMNAASNLTPTLPNSAIAPGSIFIVKGTGLGPANISIAPTPFQSTTLSGTSVALTVAGTTVNALMYYTSDKQIAALLPSNTPLSSGTPSTITVTYNGQSNPPAQFRGVVAANLGIFTIDSTGLGPAIVTYPDYSLVSGAKGPNCGAPSTPCGAANPGDTLILWGTGLGSINGNDAAGVGLGQNMPNLPLTLWLGGVQIKPIYQGRTGCCIGEDQVVFTVPAGVPTGCAVPLVAQINNQLSNSTVIPVANGSRTCTFSDLSADPAASEGLVAKLANATSLSILDIDLGKEFNNNSPGLRDTASVEAIRIGLQPGVGSFVGPFLDSPPPGVCWVTDESNPGNDEFGITGFEALNAGPSVTVSGPNGNATVDVNGDNATLSAAGTFLTPGVFTASGAGGKDVGAFNTSLTIPALPVLSGPANPTNLIVNRNAGLAVSWTGGGSGNVIVEVSNGPDAFPASRATAHCKVRASAGTFTIPPYVLLALPTGNNNNGFFYFELEVPGTLIPLTGVDFGNVHARIARAAFGGFPVR